MKYFFTSYVFASVFLHLFFTSTGSQDATAPGDIIIGGLFPIHESVSVTWEADGSDTRKCDRFSLARLVQSLIMVQAVEDINKRQELGNLTLGYHIVDSCSDVTTALKNIMPFMRNGAWMNGANQTSPPVLAVVGGYHSEISIAVTRILDLQYIPQISYGATSGFLSDKTRFPSFMRTVPEDDHQTRAIINILKRHHWTWVGVVTTDGSYGRYAVERLQQHAKDSNICFAFISILPDVLGETSLNDRIEDTVKTITENENVTVIVSFAKPNHMMYLFDALLKDHRGRGKVWVASDNWSESADVLRDRPLSEAGTIFGTTLKSGNTTRLEQYLRNLDVNPDHHKNNAFLSQFLKEKQKQKKKKPVDPSDTATEALVKMIYPYAVFSVESAVRAIARAVANLCVNRDCKTTQRLQPVEVRDALKNVTWRMDEKNYKFDNKRDLNSGYEVILWTQTPSNPVDVSYTVAHYSIEDQKMIFISKNANQVFDNATANVNSQCTESCLPGFRKSTAKGQPVCCHECYPCPADHFTNTKDATVCLSCNSTTHYSNVGSDRCHLKKTIFLEIHNKYNIILLVFTGLGALLTIVVGIIYLVHWKTPVVRSSVGPICILLLFSLLSTFVGLTLFGGRPKLWQCQARQVMFGLSFTLCVSCIMVKSFKIILAFEFDPSVKTVLEKLYKPYIIIAVCLAGQVIICSLWLIFQSPRPIWVLLTQKEERLLACNERSFPAFGAMLGYIALLALICFAVAFKGRKLPQSYNEAKFITFSMMIYFICWCTFGPVYVNVTGKYLPAVEMVIILISAYGVLFCQFFPRCYIILFKGEANTVTAFREDVRNYTLSGLSMEENGNWLSSPIKSEGIINNVFNDESPLSNSTAVQWNERSPSVSSGLTLGSGSPDSNPQLTRLQNEDNVGKKQLARYLSLPGSLPK